MLSENPKEGEMVLERLTGTGNVLFHLESAVTNQVVREVYAVETTDENFEPCFVAVSSRSYDDLPGGIVGVAHSPEEIASMAHNYIIVESDEVRKKYYPNHKLRDKTKIH